MKTPLDNLKDILSKADALAESGFPQENQEKKKSESKEQPQAEQHFETAAPDENPPNYSENIKKLDELLKAYRSKKTSLPLEPGSQKMKIDYCHVKNCIIDLRRNNNILRLN